LANPESGFSLTLKMNDPQGVENLITMRSESNELPDVSALLEDRDTLVEQLMNNGWTPAVGYKGSSNNQQSSNGNSTGGSSRGSTYGGGNRNSNRGNSNQGGGNVENCNCGVPGVRKSGNKNGRNWSAVFCKNRSCDPIFDN
jgi:hypothetical protein